MSDNGKSTGFASAAELDDRLKRRDEPRWLASRYAERKGRDCLVAVYLLDSELRRASRVSEPLLRQIRLQWWLDALTSHGAAGASAEHEVLEALARAFAVRGMDIHLAVPLVEAWWPQEEGRSGRNPQVACVELAMRCLDADVTPEEVAQAKAVVSGAVADGRRGVRRFRSGILPAVLHVAAYDRDGQASSGLRARWLLFRAALVGGVQVG